MTQLLKKTLARVRGMSLLEMVVSSLLMGSVLVAMGRYLHSVNKFVSQNNRYLNAEADLTDIGRTLDKYFTRGTAVSYTQKPGSVTPVAMSFTQYDARCTDPEISCPNGSVPFGCTDPCVATTTTNCGKDCTSTTCTAYEATWSCMTTNVPGYDIFGEGVAILSTDLRSCSTFDPTTSRQPANATQVRLACCGQGMTVNAQLPETGAAVSVTSACVDTPGLGIELVTNGVSVSKRCYSHVNNFSAAAIGFDAVRGERIYYYNFSSSEALSSGGGGSLQAAHPRLELYVVPGNSGRGFVTQCQNATTTF